MERMTLDQWQARMRRLLAPGGPIMVPVPLDTLRQLASLARQAWGPDRLHESAVQDAILEVEAGLAAIDAPTPTPGGDDAA